MKGARAQAKKGAFRLSNHLLDEERFHYLFTWNLD